MDHQSGPRQLNRRKALALCATISALAVIPGLARAGRTDRRGLTLHNLHTGEKLSTVYWADGAYLPDSLSDIATICRDFRTGEDHPIDRRLLDVAFSLQQMLGTSKPVELISGYRSPKTNAGLASQSSGVARRSLHMQGKALDVRMPGFSCSQVSKAAIALKSGGVGLYSSSNFVHIDTGRVRRWGA